MVDLLEQIRTALDELTPLLERRAVDIEMPRLTVDADATTLKRALVALIGRAVEHTEGDITVVSDWPGALAADIEAIDGRLGGGDAAVVWLTVPLSGPGAPDG